MKKTKNKPVLFLLSIVFANILFFSKVMAQELETVKIYSVHSLVKAVFYIADEEGYFKEQGIKIEDVKLQNAAEALILLNQGALDVAYSPLSAGIINLIGENKNVRLAAGAMLIGNNNVGIVLNDDKKENQNKDTVLKGLKGKKIGIPILGDLTNYLVERTLEQGGVSIKDVELVIMPLPATVTALENGIIDAGHLTEPYITLIKNKKKIFFVPFSEEFQNAQSTFIVYGPNFLVKNPELGVRFMKAYLKGCQQYSEGRTKRNIEIMKKYVKFDEETLKNANWPEVVPDFSNLTMLNGYQDWLLKKDYITRKVGIEAMLDRSFLRKAE